MKVFVKTLSGQRREVSVEPEARVASLAQAVGDLNAVAADRVKLVYKSKTLDPERTVESYSMQEGDSVVVVLLKVGSAAVCTEGE